MKTEIAFTIDWSSVWSFTWHFLLGVFAFFVFLLFIFRNWRPY